MNKSADFSVVTPSTPYVVRYYPPHETRTHGHFLPENALARKHWCGVSNTLASSHRRCRSASTKKTFRCCRRPSASWTPRSVCVCVSEREIERERESVCVWRELEVVLRLLWSRVCSAGGQTAHEALHRLGSVGAQRSSGRGGRERAAGRGGRERATGWGGEDRGAVTPDPGASHSPPALLQLHRLAQWRSTVL